MHEEIRVRDSNGGGHNDIVTLISSEYYPNPSADMVTCWVQRLCSSVRASNQIKNRPNHPSSSKVTEQYLTSP